MFNSERNCLFPDSLKGSQLSSSGKEAVTQKIFLKHFFQKRPILNIYLLIFKGDGFGTKKIEVLRWFNELYQIIIIVSYFLEKIEA